MTKKKPAHAFFQRTPVIIAMLMIAMLMVSTMGIPDEAPEPLETSSHPQAIFFERLAGLCGARFSGQASFPEDPGDAFRGKTLVAHISECSADEIRIPFHVGDDLSRTWIISRVPGGLQLKHDHRHADGTPDDITMYGGTTSHPGNELSQSFPADAHTANLIPDAATNEWFLSLDQHATRLTYYLERHGQPRFKAVLSRQSTEMIDLNDFATRYAAAWSSQVPGQLASFYTTDGVLQVNDGEPAIGRQAIAGKAAAFMAGFPDMVVRLEKLEQQAGRVRFHWHWTGTHSDPDGLGQAIDLHGFEEWTLSSNGLIQRSQGHYNEAEYARQMAVQ